MDFELYDLEINQYLYAIESIIDSYEPVSDYLDIFEADNPEVQKQVAENNQQEQNGDNFLIKTARAIKAMISSMIEKIKTFFQTLTMSKDEKAKYQAFVQKCKTDPSLKNKKITITDYRKVNAEYDALIKEAETAISNMKENQPTAVDSLIEKMENGIKGVTKGASVIVTAEVIDKFAASNREFAEMIYKKLREDEKSMQLLEEQIGHAKARDFKSRMRLFSSKNKLKQRIVKLRYKQYNNAKDAIEQTYREIKGLMNGDPNFASSGDHDENKKWYKKGNGKLGLGSSAISKNNSNGLVGKISGNQGVRNFAGGMASIVSTNASADLKNTLVRKLNLTRDARYKNLVDNKPKREDFENESKYQASRKNWEAKCAKYINSEKSKIQNEINKQAKLNAKNNEGRNKNMESFLGGENDVATDVMSIMKVLF